MSTKKNTSSIKTKLSEKRAAKSNEGKNSVLVDFSQERYSNKQVINARKGANLELAKKKAKRRAKLAKAAKRKNK